MGNSSSKHPPPSLPSNSDGTVNGHDSVQADAQTRVSNIQHQLHDGTSTNNYTSTRTRDDQSGSAHNHSSLTGSSLYYPSSDLSSLQHPAPIPEGASLTTMTHSSSLSGVPPTPSFIDFLPVIAGASALMGGGLFYGYRRGEKQATQLEETYAEYEVKPSKETKVEITPQMRRYAFRQAFSAFGIGTALCMSCGLAASYAACNHWQVYTVRDLSIKLAELTTGYKASYIEPYQTNMPGTTSDVKIWFSRTWIGSILNVQPPSPTLASMPMSADEAAELAIITDEAATLEKEWQAKWNKQLQDESERRPTQQTNADT